MKAFVARNHNGTVLAWNTDLGNLAEEAMIYEEVTGNRVTIGEEEFEEDPVRNIFSQKKVDTFS
jgi:hypothetical protein